MKVKVYGNAAGVTGRPQYRGKDISGQYRFTDS
jgi:hypothetical protein